MELWGGGQLDEGSSSPTSTMSGRTEVTKVFSSMVDNGLSFAHIPERAAYSIISLSRCSWISL